MVTVVGFLFGYNVTEENNKRLSKMIKPWETLDPHVMLLIFMPALIYESASNTDPYIFWH
jgi:hypothetical protein